MLKKNIRLEVMQQLEDKVDNYIKDFLIPVDNIWQPTDFLPNSQKDSFFDEVTELRELAKELPYDFWVVLVGDTITEEALPTYESWLMDVEGISQQNGGTSWTRWVRYWTGEENRHGDVLNKYLYLSGRVDMKEIEKTTHHLINDGFDIGTDQDPYKNFVYTSFQELATYISHNRVAKLAKQYANKSLSRMCQIISGDEMRHYNAYSTFVKDIFSIDPSGMMIAFKDMMKHKIIMPAHFLRESGKQKASAFDEFSDAAQRLGVYTGQDYIDIMKRLIQRWDIENLNGLSEEAEKARDFVVKLPARMQRINERIRIPQEITHFAWVNPAMVK
ncbi:MAG: acyl-ACP desaturase [Mesonia hippocampi]|uniref:Acyl-[acyl-carrier-protein] desaturase n=1 Tax=Mesonia hippocampi TaxID=1628250 RepID=A0A840ENI6_9FLAO|nr:acyl-ACP desaturase [Mesonia hippocampi]MBB4118530.1 acyl-[acyl-carrier-protein] desaturase [Mesonia hippocampi]